MNIANILFTTVPEQSQMVKDFVHAMLWKIKGANFALGTVAKCLPWKADIQLQHMAATHLLHFCAVFYSLMQPCCEGGGGGGRGKEPGPRFNPSKLQTLVLYLQFKQNPVFAVRIFEALDLSVGWPDTDTIHPKIFFPDSEQSFL